jgi:GSH-dependent disulfide-bond oxidoreductase
VIQVYAFATPNSMKAPIALEELEVPYDLHAINIRQAEQNSSAFGAKNANGKFPVESVAHRPGVLLAIERVEALARVA